jgi:hypothetical protein
MLVSRVTLWFGMSRRLLLAVLVIVLAAIGGMVFVHSTLNADVLRGAAETRLSALLGQPVSIGLVRVSLLPVPAVVGSDVTVGAEREAPELALERIRIVPRLRSLVSGPYVIREVTLEGLIVRIVREPPGHWKFPAVVPAPGGGDSGVIVERVRLRRGRVRVFELTPRGGLHEMSTIEEIEGEASADGAGIRVSPIRGRVGGAEISGEAVVNPEQARIDFAMTEIAGDDLDEVLGLAASAPPEFVSLPRPASMSMSVRIDRAKSRLTGTGSLRAPEVGFYSLRLHGLEAPIATDGVKLTFAPATFTMYGGSHRGTLAVDLSSQRARWTLDSRVRDLDVSDFLSALAERAQSIDGVGAATASLGARIGDPMPAGLAGRMQVNIADGVIREFPLLSAINRALRLAEGDARDTRFERLSATLVFPGSGARSAGDAASAGYATTDDLVLDAREVHVAAAGRIGFDRSLDLRGQAVISSERSAQAIRSVRELSGLRNDGGELELPVRIRGTLDDPSIQVDVGAAVGRSLKEELRRRIRGLIRR